MRPAFQTLLAVSLIASAGAAIARPSHPMKGAELAPQATVTLAAARTTALKAHPGKITDQELESEAGGSGLRYSFDITAKGKAYEVGVDAKSGEVLENKAEGKNPD